MRYADEDPRWADDSHCSVKERYGLAITTVNCSQSALRVHHPNFASSWRAFLEHIFGDFLRNLDRLIGRGNLTLHVAHNQPHQVSTRLYIEVRLERDPRTQPVSQRVIFQMHV